MHPTPKSTPVSVAKSDALFCIILTALAFILLWNTTAVRAQAGGIATVLTIDDGIGPATSDYIIRGLEEAQSNGSVLVIIEMDTPGGLDASMRDIVEAILASPVPVATYVTPSGARAASAGTYILYASHIAAMAPATNLGAATPVNMIPGAKPPQGETGKDEGEKDESGDEDESEKQTPAPGTAMERKVLNDAVAYIRGLAERHGRNVEWAEKAVIDADSLTASDALEQNVVDIIADDIPDLLQKIDGRAVKLQSGDATLATTNLTLQRHAPDWRSRLLAVITNPSTAYLLLLVGIYGLMFEGYNPGAIVPGVVGAIALLLALYAMQVLPINYAGLALIILGVVLMISETFVPSFGALGIGGVVAFVLGSIILIDSDVPGLSISKGLIGTVATVAGGAMLALITMAVRRHRAQPVSGVDQMIGASAIARDDFDTHGHVFIHGELWQATSTQPVTKGQSVIVTAIDGLILSVKPV